MCWDANIFVLRSTKVCFFCFVLEREKTAACIETNTKGYLGASMGARKALLFAKKHMEFFC